MEQRINYTTSRDGWRLAWSAIGTGSPVLYMLTKWHLMRTMEEPRLAAAIRRAAAGRTVLRFDLRGTGMSQRKIPAMSQSIVCDDIETVLDPELPIAEAAETERIPAPAHHQVVAIGALWIDSHGMPRRLAIIGEDRDEAGILTDFEPLELMAGRATRSDFRKAAKPRRNPKSKIQNPKWGPTSAGRSAS